jgi:hypothetical protein
MSRSLVLIQPPSAILRLRDRASLVDHSLLFRDTVAFDTFLLQLRLASGLFALRSSCCIKLPLSLIQPRMNNIQVCLYTLIIEYI